VMPLATLAAFVRRDWQRAVSYRVPFALEIFSTLLGLTLFYYLGRLVDASGVRHHELDKGYFAYAVIGVALLEIGHTGLSAFAQKLRDEQTTGTLEALAATPTSSSLIIVGSAAYDMLRATATAFGMIALGMLLFGLRLEFDPVAFPVALVSLAACVLLFAALGIAMAAFTIVFKQTTALLGMVLPAIALLSGVYFPIDVLPRVLETLARASPFTWGLEVLRAALLEGRIDWWQFAVLIPAAAVAVPLGLAVFHAALRRAKRDGTLAQY
jgi:ABC-2 type transport system permease protein